jgi:competence protein ComEA
MFYPLNGHTSRCAHLKRVPSNFILKRDFMMKHLFGRLAAPVFLLALMLLGPFINLAYALDINTATVEELQTLKGIGPKRAEAIIRYRGENGPIRSAQDLLSVPGVGVSVITANGEELTFASNKPATPPK